MKRRNVRLFFAHGVVLTLIFLALGSILVPMVDGSDRLISFMVLVGSYVALLMLFYQVYINYVLPINGLVNMVENLLAGNYKVRMKETYHQDTGKLQKVINQLARQIETLNRQEKTHARQLNSVIENMASGIMLIDEQGYVDLVNKRFVDLFGETRKDYIGGLYYQVLDEEKIHHTVQDAFLYEQTVKESIILRGKNQALYIEVIGAPFFNASKDLRGVVLVFHDITELKQLEQVRKDFVANVSHELRTPITSIKGFAETLLDDSLEDQELEKKFLSIIYKESDRLQLLIQDLLELSKLEKEAFKLTYSNMKLSVVINESIDLVSLQANDKAIQIETSIESDPVLKYDYGRIKQVLLNLLYNAISYTPESGIVKVELQELNGWIKLAIHDNGMGIPESGLSRIFERFYRVDKARSRNTGGTGLGLAIVKHIVEAHHGHIEVDSEINKGSTFSIYLPMEQDS